MQQAQNQARQGNQAQAQLTNNQASNQLEQAAQQAEQAAQELARVAQGQPQRGQPQQSQAQQGQPQQSQTGQNVKQAQGQMNQAQNKLGQGKTQSAQASMKQAAQSLKQAAKQMAKNNQPGQPQENTLFPGKRGADGNGPKQAIPVVKGFEKYAGKPWGELPGKLKTKILQDMKVKFGDDYARLIKLYFEQMADTRKKK
jgi:hypothetical protein